MVSQATDYRDTDKASGAPDAEYVRGLIKDYKEYYRVFHDQCRVADMYFYNQNPIPIPDQVPADEVHMGTARTVITTAVDHINTENINIEVRASGRAQPRAERIQKSLQGIWLSIKDPVLRTALFQQGLYGIGFIKPQFDADQWPDVPKVEQFDNDPDWHEAMKHFLELRKISFPLACKNINPKDLIWDDARSGPKWAIEHYENVPVGRLRKWYPQWVTLAANDDTQDYDVYWDDTWYGVMVGGEWITRPYKHGYGRMPIIPAISANSINYDAAPPEARFQGLLHSSYDLLDAEDRIASAMEAILKSYAWPSMDFSGANATTLDEAADNYALFRSMNKLPNGVTLSQPPRPVPPQELFSVIGLFQSQIENNTVAGVVRGQRPAGVSSGFGVSVLAGSARLRFGPMADGLSRAVEKANEIFLRIIETKIGTSITVSARSEVQNFDQKIGPDDIRGLYENRVAFKAESPEERERASQLAISLHGSGLISLTEAQRRVGIVNPLEEQIQMIAERIAEAAEMIQIEQVAAELAQDDVPSVQAGASADVSGQRGAAFNSGQFQPGMPQPQILGNSGAQGRRVNTRNMIESVFPEGIGQLGNLGSRASDANGGGIALPSGGRSTGS